LTEVNLTGRPILAGNIHVAPGTAPTPTTHQTAPASGGSSGLWIALIAGLLGIVMMAGAGWWVWNRTSIFKPKPVPDSPLVHQPSIPADDPHKTADPGKTSTPSIPPTPPTPPVLPKVSAIQTLINEAKPGSEVVVPEGNYEEQLHFREGIKLKAAPGARVIVQTDGRVGAALLVENCKTGSISGIIFQHTGSEAAQNVSWPVALVKSSSITLENCTVQSGVSDGMIITGVGSPQVLRCTVKNNAKNGIVFEAGVTGTVVATECRLNGASGVELRNSGTRPTLQSCALVDNQLAGISVKDGAAVNVLEKTRCQGNKDAGMAAAGEGVELTVVDAICENNGVGIAVQEFAKGSIRDSTIRGCESHGIQFGMTADGTEVVNNTITGSKGEGMLITGANGRVVTITGNKVSDGGANGIGVFGAGFKPKIENNECLKNAEYGILAIEGVSGIIRDNTVRDNHSGAIAHEGAAADLVIEGNITDGK
jgi:nitrous oxidase accessory protein NosD